MHGGVDLNYSGNGLILSHPVMAPKPQVTDEELLPLLEVMEEFRAFHKEVPAQVLSTFLYIATHNPCHLRTLQDDLKMKQGSASRCTDWLADINRLKKPGLNLIKKEPDPLCATRMVLSLTAKGERLAANLRKILYG